MKNRHFIRNWLILLALLAVIAFFGYQSFNTHQLDPVDPKNTELQAFVIERDENAGQVAADLKEQGLIHSTSAFLDLMKEQGIDGKLQPGDYKLSPSMSGYDIAKQLSTGPEDLWVTLLEGWRNEEMAQRLSKSLGIDEKAFLKVAREGHMFPDTYLFNKDATAETVASTLKNTFDQRYSQEVQARIKAKGLTAEQGIILASLVEREARTPEVKKQVASIMLKRLKIGMGLNIDATIQYALGYQTDEKSWWKRHLTYDDLKFESPYNTYIHAGLPPTAICNPGLASIEAVAAADASTPYLYYFHDSQGNTYYAKTLDEHNENVAAHR